MGPSNGMTSEWLPVNSRPDTAAIAVGRLDRTGGRDDDLLFVDDDVLNGEVRDDYDSLSVASRGGVWSILIVDDDEAIHATTRMVLRGFTFQNRPVTFLSAASGREARSILEQDPEIAVVLLDVVMESDDAGLRLVRYIRETLGNTRIRIILRTGQPGQAPERDVILNYDINDYKSKAELTAQKLFTSVVAALRSYQDISSIERHRIGLEKILNASSVLLDRRSSKAFVDETLRQLDLMLHGPDGSMICSGHPAEPEAFTVLAAKGAFLANTGRPPAEMLSLSERQDVEASIRSGNSRFAFHHAVVVLRSEPGGRSVLVIRRGQPVLDDERRLLEVFCSKLAIGYDNVCLYEALSDLNRDLERQVQVRTRELAEATRAAEAARAEAEAANQAKSLFLATMSHEIRTPMNGVQGMLELLEFTSLNAEQRELISVVRESATALLTIINDILDFSKIEAGRLELERVPLSLAGIVEGVGETLAPQARKKGLFMAVWVDPALPTRLLGDPVRLRQILFNIAGNAVKFTAAGSVTVRADLDRISGDMVTVVLSIADTGIGISPEDRGKLFQPFTQANAATMRQHGGTGLGLSICRRLTELMGGDIGLDSTLGVGSRFWVRLTLGRVPAPEIGSRLANVRIRLVDDGADPAHVTALLRLLEAEAAEVSVVSLAVGTGPEAPGWMSSAANVVVVLSGPAGTAAGALLSNAASVPVVHLCLTPAATASERVSALAMPVRRAQLVRAILAALGRQPAEAEPTGEPLVSTVVSGPVAPSVTQAEAAGRLILVVDDHVINRQVLHRQLTLLGYAAELATHGKEALALLRHRRFGLLLTDCLMPEMDGYALSRAIRSEESKTGLHLPIVAITANVMEDDVQRCLASGMDETLSKPLRIIELKRILERYVPLPGPPFGAVVVPPMVQAASLPAMAEPVDWSYLESLFGSDPALIRQLIAEFLNANLDIQSQLNNALQTGTWEVVRRNAHKLAGAARTLGAQALAEIGEQIELAVVHGEVATIPPLAEQSLRELHRIELYAQTLQGPA